MKRYLTWKEIWDNGIAMEVNRCLLHPRGLALEYQKLRSDATEDSMTSVCFYRTDVAKLRKVFDKSRLMMEASGEWSQQWELYFDSLFERVKEAEGQLDVAYLRIWKTDDPEGVTFGDLNQGDKVRAKRFTKLINWQARVKGCGFVIEPHHGRPADKEIES